MVLGRVRKRSVEVVEVVDHLAYLVAAEGVVLLADSGQGLSGLRGVVDDGAAVSDACTVAEAGVVADVKAGGGTTASAAVYAGTGAGVEAGRCASAGARAQPAVRSRRMPTEGSPGAPRPNAAVDAGVGKYAVGAGIGAAALAGGKAGVGAGAGADAGLAADASSANGAATGGPGTGEDAIACVGARALRLLGLATAHPPLRSCVPPTLYRSWDCVLLLPHIILIPGRMAGAGVVAGADAQTGLVAVVVAGSAAGVGARARSDARPGRTLVMGGSRGRAPAESAPPKS